MNKPTKQATENRAADNKNTYRQTTSATQRPKLKYTYVYIKDEKCVHKI